MARGRILSRSLGSSEKFFELHAQLAGVGLGEFAGELFMLLVANADDFGRHAGDAFTVKHAVYPISTRTIDEFDRALDAMHAATLIVRYRYAGGTKTAIQIVKVDEHNGALDRKQPSKYPTAPAEQLAAVDDLSDDVERVLCLCAPLVAVTTDDIVPTESIIDACAGEMTAVRLAATLSKIGIYPHQVRVGELRVRGYDKAELSHAVTAVTGVTTEEKRIESNGIEPKITAQPDGSACVARVTTLQEPIGHDEPVDVSFDDDVLAPATVAGKRKRKPAADVTAQRAQIAALVDCYRAAAPRLQPVTELTKTRSLAAAAALKREPSIERWRIYFERLNRSTFCAGGSGSGWRASFDWSLKPETWVKTFEGTYDDRKPSSARVIRTADDARSALRERGVEHVQQHGDIDLH